LDPDIKSGLPLADGCLTLASDSNPQPSDPKEWDSSDHRSWDAGSLPGDLKTRYAHLARFARYASDIPGTQDEAARVMDDILTPTPIDLKVLEK
jgi:hypothetical protein